MTHNIQPGVILVKVCGEHLLVATREARGKCPYVKQLNATGAYFWTLLAQNMTLGEMTQAAAQRYGAPPERIRPGLEKFLADLEKSGYLRPAEPAQGND